MANGLSDDLAQAALMGQTPEEEQNNLMQAGLGLGGAAFAAQTGRAPTPVPMGGQPSPLAQQVAQNDAARQAAVRQTAAASRPIGSNLPANPASPAVGSSGGTRLPSNPSVAAARQAAATSAQRAVPSLASRALPMLGQGGSAFAGGYTLGSVLDNAFDISGNIARRLFPDAPTLTREERAALGQPGVEAVSDMVARTDDSIIGNTQPTSRFQDIISQAAMGQIPMGPGGPTSGFVTPAQSASNVVATEAARKMLFSPERPSFSQAAQQEADQPFVQAAFDDRSTSQIVTDAIVRDPDTEAGAAQSAALGGEMVGAGTVLKEPSQIMSEAGVPTMQETIAGLTELAAPTTPTAPTLPEGVEPGSPQATFLAERARGELSPARIAQAQEFAASMGTTFDPETGYSRQPFLSAQASRLGRPMEGQTLSQFMRYEDRPQDRTEQFVEPGTGRIRRRLTPSAATLQGLDPTQGLPLSPEYMGYEKEAAAREASIAARPDFMQAQPVSSRADKQYTDAQLRDIFGGGDALQRAKGMQDAGIDPVTGKRPEEKTQAEQELEQARLDLIRAQTERAKREEPAPDPELEGLQKEQIQTSIAASRARLAEAGLRPTGDPEVDPETGIITQMYSDGVKKFLGQVPRNQISDIDLSDLGAGFVPTDSGTSGYTEDQESNISKVMKRFNISRAEAIKELEQANRV